MGKWVAQPIGVADNSLAVETGNRDRLVPNDMGDPVLEEPTAILIIMSDEPAFRVVPTMDETLLTKMVGVETVVTLQEGIDLEMVETLDDHVLEMAETLGVPKDLEMAETLGVPEDLGMVETLDVPEDLGMVETGLATDLEDLVTVETGVETDPDDLGMVETGLVTDQEDLDTVVVAGVIIDPESVGLTMATGMDTDMVTDPVGDVRDIGDTALTVARFGADLIVQLTGPTDRLIGLTALPTGLIDLTTDLIIQWLMPMRDRLGTIIRFTATLIQPLTRTRATSALDTVTDMVMEQQPMLRPQQ